MDPLALTALAGLACLGAYWIVVRPAARPAFLLAASLAVVLSFGLLPAGLAAADVAIAWAAVRRGDRDPAQRRLRVALAITWLVGTLAWFKYARLLPGGAPLASGWRGIGLPLGLSYVVFRLVSYLIDVSKGRVGHGSLADVAGYVLFFPTFLAGPVDRYGAIHAQACAGPAFDLRDIARGLERILIGAFKKVVVADSLPYWIAPVLDAPAGQPRWALLLATYGLTLQVYMDFAGYTDMALGVSRLFGYRVVENFDHPFLRTNIAAFWRSWHISVYTFIRDTVFLPVFARSPTRLKTSLGLVATMVVFMLWHEGSPSFLLLGLYHGAGLAGWYLLQELKVGRPALRAALAGRTAGLLGWLLTLHFVAAGFLLFRYDVGHVAAILRSAAGP